MLEQNTVKVAEKAIEQRTFLLPIDVYDLETPLFALFTRTQVVEILDASTVSWQSSATGAVRGVCNYGVDSFPVLDIATLCTESSVEAGTSASPKQIIVIRTGEINGNRSFKLAFSAPVPIRIKGWTQKLLTDLKNDRNEIPPVLKNRDIIRGFFVHPDDLHYALLDIRAIAKFIASNYVQA